MDNSNLYNTGTGLSGLDNGYFQQITADQIIVESNLQLPNGLTLPTDILPLQNNRDALNALPSGEVIVKGASDDTFSSTPNNSSNWDTAYTDSQTNKSDILTIKGTGWTNETIKQNADDIATNSSNITQNQNDITTIKGAGWTNETIKQNSDDIATNASNIVPLQDNRDALNALTSGEVIVKGASDDTYSSIPVSNDFSSTTNDIVRKTSGRIKTDTISIGDDTSTLGDANIKKTSGNSELFLISPASNIPRLYLIRNGGSDTFGGDGASDWTMMNQSGNIVFERGNAFLSNGYLTPFRITFYNTIELNYYNSGAIVDVCPLRHYRQISGNLNSYYVDVKPSTNVAGAYTQLLPAESGTYITDATTEYVNLNTMNTNINSLSDNELMIKTGTNTFSSTPNNSSNWDTAYTDSQTNKSDIATNTGNIATNTSNIATNTSNIATNTSNIATNTSNIATNTSWRSDFDTQTLNNLLFRDGSSSFGNIGIDDGFGSGSLIVKKDTGTIKSQNFLAEQAGNGYMFQSFSNPAVISYLYHSNNSGLGVAVEMPSSSGILGLTSQIEWTKSGTLIQPKTLTDRLALGVSAPPSVARLNFGSDVESKICLYGDNSHMYGFGVSANQLNYHVYSSGDRHVFYAGGTNGNGSELMRIQGNKQIFLGQSGGDGVGATGDVVISNRNGSTVEIELRSDDITLSSPNDWLIGKIQGGWDSGSYADAFIKFQTHFTNNTTLNDLLTLKASNATLNGTLETTGDVGIGKSPSIGKLDVDGSIVSSGSSSELSIVSRSSPSTKAWTLYSGSGDFQIYSQATSTDRLTIEPTGNVGIGITPSYKLHVSADALLYTALIGTHATVGNSADYASFCHSSMTGVGQYSLIQNSSGFTSLNAPSGQAVNFNINNVEKMRLDSNGNIGIGTNSPSLKLTVAPVNSNDSMVIKGHYNNIDTFLGCGGNVPASGPVYRDSILACGNASGGGTAGTTYGIINGFRQSYIESLGTYSFQSHNSSTTPTNIMQLHKSSGDVDINTGSVDIQSGNLEVRSGTTGAGVYAEVGIAKIGNGISNYAMFSHKDQHSVQNYALLQSDLGETFINAKLGKKIYFRINNNDIGVFDNTSGSEKTEFTFPNFLGIYPTFDSSGKLASNYCSLDNPTFRVYNALARQGHAIQMYNQVVCDSATSGFTQCAFPTIAYGTQPGYPSGFPGNAFRMCDPNDYIEIDMHWSGYTSSTNGLQTIILQFFARTTSGTGVWTNIFQESFYINDRYQHVYLSVSKYVQLTHSFYTHARIITSGGTFTGDSGDFFKLVVRNVPRQSQ